METGLDLPCSTKFCEWLILMTLLLYNLNSGLIFFYLESIFALTFCLQNEKQNQKTKNPLKLVPINSSTERVCQEDLIFLETTILVSDWATSIGISQALLHEFF